MEIIHKHFETLSSTNDYAKNYLKDLSPDQLLLVTADVQTAGRGQYGRKWVSPQGENIYASFAFFAHEWQEPLELTHLFALSTAKSLKQWGLNCQIKRPNDLFINGKKIGGILCETEKLGSYFGIVIGIGLNVNMPKEKLQSIDQPATSLLEQTGQVHELPLILDSIKTHFTSQISRCRQSHNGLSCGKKIRI